MSERLRSNQEAIAEFNSRPELVEKYRGRWVIFVDGAFQENYTSFDKRFIVANYTVQENDGVALEENRYVLFKVPVKHEITPSADPLSSLESMRSQLEQNLPKDGNKVAKN